MIIIRQALLEKIKLRKRNVSNFIMVTALILSRNLSAQTLTCPTTPPQMPFTPVVSPNPDQGEIATGNKAISINLPHLAGLPFSLTWNNIEAYYNNLAHYEEARSRRYEINIPYLWFTDGVGSLLRVGKNWRGTTGIEGRLVVPLPKSIVNRYGSIVSSVTTVFSSIPKVVLRSDNGQFITLDLDPTKSWKEGDPFTPIQELGESGDSLRGLKARLVFRADERDSLLILGLRFGPELDDIQAIVREPNNTQSTCYRVTSPVRELALTHSDESSPELSFKRNDPYNFAHFNCISSQNGVGDYTTLNSAGAPFVSFSTGASIVYDYNFPSASWFTPAHRDRFSDGKRRVFKIHAPGKAEVWYELHYSLENGELKKVVLKPDNKIVAEIEYHKKNGKETFFIKRVIQPELQQDDYYCYYPNGAIASANVNGALYTYSYTSNSAEVTIDSGNRIAHRELYTDGKLTEIQSYAGNALLAKSTIIRGPDEEIITDTITGEVTRINYEPGTKLIKRVENRLSNSLSHSNVLNRGIFGLPLIEGVVTNDRVVTYGRTFNSNGQLTFLTVKDGGSEVSYDLSNRDSRGNLTKIIEGRKGRPSVEVASFSYNNHNLLISSTDFFGDMQYYSYDTIGRLNEQRDNLGRVVFRADGKDKFGNPTQITTPYDTITYEKPHPFWLFPETIQHNLGAGQIQTIDRTLIRYGGGSGFYITNSMRNGVNTSAILTKYGDLMNYTVNNMSLIDPRGMVSKR